MGFLLDSLLLEVGMLLTCILAVLYIYFKWSHTYWKKRNVPYIEPTFPFGNLLHIFLGRKPIADIFAAIYNTFEGHKYGGTYVFTIPRFLARDPDLIKDILVKDFSSFHDRGVYMNEEIEPLSAHLFSLSGMKWRNLRIKLTPVFTTGKLKMMFQRLVECGQELQTCLEKVGERGDVIEIKEILARFSTDIISSCAFGIECNCLKNEDAEFRKWGRKIFEPSLKNSVIGLLSSIAPAVLDTLKLSTLDSDVTKYFRNMVQETVEYREKNHVKRNDFLQLLIQLKNKSLLDNEEKAEDKNNETNKNSETAEGTYSPNYKMYVIFVYLTNASVLQIFDVITKHTFPIDKKIMTYFMILMSQNNLYVSFWPSKALYEARWTSVSCVIAKPPFWKMLGVTLVFFQNGCLKKLMATIPYNIIHFISRSHFLLPGHLRGLSSGTILL
jgi:hypothetical protein